VRSLELEPAAFQANVLAQMAGHRPFPAPPNAAPRPWSERVGRARAVPLAPRPLRDKQEAGATVESVRLKLFASSATARESIAGVRPGSIGRASEAYRTSLQVRRTLSPSNPQPSARASAAHEGGSVPFPIVSHPHRRATGTSSGGIGERFSGVANQNRVYVRRGVRLSWKTSSGAGRLPTNPVTR
jgi:hypothetical protein